MKGASESVLLWKISCILRNHYHRNPIAKGVAGTSQFESLHQMDR